MSDLLNPKFVRYILFGIICFSITFCLWGIKKDLPFVVEPDEETFVQRAVNTAAFVDINPFWFGNPGTITYPLVFLYRVQHILTHGGSLLHPDETVQSSYETNRSDYYIIGRLLSALYAVLSLILIYQLGRDVFSSQVGIIGGWFSALYPITLEHAQVIRTDTAGLFFGLLALVFCLKLLDHPTFKYQILAGAAIALGIASRLTLISLVCVLAAVDLAIVFGSDSKKIKRHLYGIMVGLLSMVIAFILFAPYFFLDFTTAFTDLQKQARTVHLGADGLTPYGNFIWYISDAIPASVTLPLAVFTAIGIILLVMRRYIKQVLILGFVVIYLVNISIHPLHWQRWLIQILPLFSLFAADALITLTKKFAERFKLNEVAQRIAFAGFLVFLSSFPLYQLIVFDIRQANPSTRVIAREWILQNIPIGSKIAQEAYTAPIEATHYKLFQHFSLAAGRSLDDYREEKYDFLMVSSSMYGRYFAQGERYPMFISFYKSLFDNGHLVKQFEPSFTRRGPIIKIYTLRDT